jgi:hypothetical protein
MPETKAQHSPAGLRDMVETNNLLRELCRQHGISPDLLERLISCEENKKNLIRKKGLKKDIWRILEEEIARQENAP